MFDAPGASQELFVRVKSIELELKDILFTLEGEEPKASAEEVPPSPVSLRERVSALKYTHWQSTSNITGTEKMAMEILMDEFPPVLEKIKQIKDVEIPVIEKELDKLGAPYTPGRLEMME